MNQRIKRWIVAHIGLAEKSDGQSNVLAIVIVGLLPRGWTNIGITWHNVIYFCTNYQVAKLLMVFRSVFKSHRKVTHHLVISNLATKVRGSQDNNPVEDSDALSYGVDNR